MVGIRLHICVRSMNCERCLCVHICQPEFSFLQYKICNVCVRCVTVGIHWYDYSVGVGIFDVGNEPLLLVMVLKKMNREREKMMGDGRLGYTYGSTVHTRMMEWLPFVSFICGSCKTLFCVCFFRHSIYINESWPNEALKLVDYPRGNESLWRRGHTQMTSRS